jgi:hypothetical protein
VSVHFTCLDESGEQVLEESRGQGDPLTFEVGAGEVFSNKLIQVRKRMRLTKSPTLHPRGAEHDSLKPAASQT